MSLCGPIIPNGDDVVFTTRSPPPQVKSRGKKDKKKEKEKRKRKKKIKGEEEEELKDLIRCMELYILRCSITVFQINPVFRELSMLLLLLP